MSCLENYRIAALLLLFLRGRRTSSRVVIAIGFFIKGFEVLVLFRLRGGVSTIGKALNDILHPEGVEAPAEEVLDTQTGVDAVVHTSATRPSRLKVYTLNTFS